MYAHEPGPQASQKARSQAPGAKTVAAARPLGLRSGRAASVLALQRLAGNAAVTRLIAAQRRGAVDAALAVQGHRLTPQVRASMEARLGADFSDVRVHTGPAADRAARAVAARAFTTGSHLVFGRGGYAPSSAAGKRVLAHELAHVLQQRRGPVAGTGSTLRISDPSDRFEREAEAVAERATNGRPAASAGLALVRPRAGQPDGSTQALLPVQRHYTGRAHLTYGSLRNDCGTEMHAELHPPAKMGSVPSVKPNWWPTAGSGVSQATVNWFSRFMVQGHLLNHNIGGPGNTMKNLTPITKTANHNHLTAVENGVKAAVNRGEVVHYQVWSVYSPTLAGADIVGNTDPANGATVASDIDNNFARNLVNHLHCEWDSYDAKGNSLISHVKADIIHNQSQ